MRYAKVNLFSWNQLFTIISSEGYLSNDMLQKVLELIETISVTPDEISIMMFVRDEARGMTNERMDGYDRRLIVLLRSSPLVAVYTVKKYVH